MASSWVITFQPGNTWHVIYVGPNELPFFVSVVMLLDEEEDLNRLDDLWWEEVLEPELIETMLQLWLDAVNPAMSGVYSTQSFGLEICNLVAYHAPHEAPRPPLELPEGLVPTGIFELVVTTHGLQWEANSPVVDVGEGHEDEEQSEVE